MAPRAPSKVLASLKARKPKAKPLGVTGVQSDKNPRSLAHLGSDKHANHSRVQRNVITFLHAPAFEYSMGSIIVINIFVMIIEIDNSADLEEASTSKFQWTEVFGWAVLFMFMVELLLRLFAFRGKFWLDAWNIFDFIIVATDVSVCFLALVFGKLFPVTMLRIFRLAKLARVSKVLRVFPELRMLLSCIMSALSAILWGAVLLGLVLLGWAMAAVLFIHPLNKQIDYDDCERCPRAYSSVMAASLTFWRQIVAGDSWGKDTIPLMEKYPGTAVFFIRLYLTVGMTILSLILGMIVSVATQAKDDIKQVDNARAAAAKLEKQSNLLKLCKDMDTDNSGEVSQDELLVAFETPGEFRDSMEMLGISREDFDVVWALMDTECGGSVPYKKLVSRLYGLKTSNTQFTLAYLKYHITLIREMLMEQLEDEHAELQNEEFIIEEELKRMAKKGDLIFERQEQLFEKLQAAPAGHAQWHNGSDVATRKQNGESLAEDDARGTGQVQVLFEKLFLALEKEYKVNGSSAQAAEGEEPETEAAMNEPLLALRRHLSIDAGGSESKATSSIIDEIQNLFKTVCHDIEMLRSEFKDALRKVDRRLGSTVPTTIPHLSALDRGMSSESHLGLLVVPKTEKASSCSLFGRCK